MGQYFEDLSGSLSLKDKAFHNIKSQIINGNLEPGSRLCEEDLSREMKISRAPIREALNRLEKEGFTVIIPRKGAVVSYIKEKDVDNISEMRKLLEPYAAQISLDKIIPEELAAMERKLKKVLEQPEDFAAYVESDMELHELLYKYIDNALLKNTLTMVNEHWHRIRYFAESNAAIPRDVVLEVTREHLAIIEALKKSDQDMAVNTVLLHVVNGNKRTLAAFKNKSDA